MKIYKFFELIFYQLTKVKWNHTETKEWNVFFSSLILTLLIYSNIFSVFLLLKNFQITFTVSKLLFLTIGILIMLASIIVFGRYSRYKKIIVNYQDANFKKNKRIYTLYIIVTVVLLFIGLVCSLGMPIIL